MILIDHRDYSLEDVRRVAVLGEEVSLSEDAVWRGRMERSRALLAEALERGEPVYGVSSGVGNSSSVAVARPRRRGAARGPRGRWP